VKKWFRFETQVNGTAEPMVDWYYGETETEAREAWEEDCHRYGLPKDKITVTIREATPEETEACERGQS
jgi:hypothetical protein